MTKLILDARTMTSDSAFASQVRALTAQIEENLGWGNGLEWSTRDFEQLSVKIREKTGVQLSTVTLKRVWGKIDYTGKPTITTLNALTEFACGQTWQQFRQHFPRESAVGTTQPVVATNEGSSAVNGQRITGANQSVATTTGPYSKVLLCSLAALCATAIVLYFASFRPSATNRGRSYAFSSKKVVDTGVPNTVVFDYDASACDDDDSVSIQQSWDPTLSSPVDPRLKKHTSIYYYPGFFDARLKVNGEIVQTHELLIKSNGWLPLLDTRPSPVYFNKDDVMQDGILALPIARIRETQISMQPDPPWCSYYRVGDVPEIHSDDFVFETRVRNDFGEGAAACRYTELHILFQGAAMVLPLSIPGCVSNLQFHDISGKVTDLSLLGVALGDWVDLKFQVEDTVAHMFINHRNAFDLKVHIKPVPWVGMIYRFKGTGSVDFVRVSRNNGEVIFEESF